MFLEGECGWDEDDEDEGVFDSLFGSFNCIE
jgi:hypothetical protein